MSAVYPVFLVSAAFDGQPAATLFSLLDHTRPTGGRSNSNSSISLREWEAPLRSVIRL